MNSTVVENNVASVRPSGQNIGTSQCNDERSDKESSVLDKTILRLDTAIEKLRKRRFVLTLKKIGYS